jgi:hypothetical protein
MEDLLRYLNEVVDPTIKDFEANPTSVRHAFLACLVTFHSVDYLAYPQKSRTARVAFRKNEDFAIVDQVAHAFEHVVSDWPRHRQMAAADVVTRPPAVAGVMVPGLSRPGDTFGGITIFDEASIDLLAVVRRAAKFLRDQVTLRL